MTAKTAKAKLSTARAIVIDQLGQYDQDAAPLKELEKKAAPLRAQIRSWFPDLAPEANITAEGFKFLVTVGPCENERVINSLLEVLDRVGSEAFLARCGLTLKNLREMVTPPDFEKLTTETRTGSRPVKTFARSKA